eukprot:123317-Rhodomonas_salina.1
MLYTQAPSQVDLQLTLGIQPLESELSVGATHSPVVLVRLLLRAPIQVIADKKSTWKRLLIVQDTVFTRRGPRRKINLVLRTVRRLEEFWREIDLELRSCMPAEADGRKQAHAELSFVEITKPERIFGQESDAVVLRGLHSLAVDCGWRLLDVWASLLSQGKFFLSSARV